MCFPAAVLEAANTLSNESPSPSPKATLSRLRIYNVIPAFTTSQFYFSLAALFGVM